MLRIDDWDFDYQAIYQCREPVALPANSTFSFTEKFDNSDDNPRNPNQPPKPVSWGTSTTDEMAVVGLEYTFDSEHLMQPQVSAAAIVNSASFAGGASAPGTVMTLYGSALGSFWETAASSPLPRTLGHGVKVTVDGVDAPLFYASPTQVNFQVPLEVASATATVTLTRSDDAAEQSVQLPIKTAHPGIYTLTGDGKGAANAAHATGTPVSADAPAARGEWLVMYANGLGKVAPPVPSGAPPTELSGVTNNVTVSVGGINAEVYFAGLTPGFISLYQVNFRVPPDAPVGGSVAVTVSVGGETSNSATLNVK